MLLGGFYSLKKGVTGNVPLLPPPLPLLLTPAQTSGCTAYSLVPSLYVCTSLSSKSLSVALCNSSEERGRAQAVMLIAYMQMKARHHTASQSIRLSRKIVSFG